MDPLEDDIFFDRVFKSKGGIYPTTKIPQFGIMLKLCERLLNTKQRSQEGLPKPILRYVNNTIFNAQATVANDEYLIGVYIGLVAVFHEVTMRVLSSNKTFAWIGDRNAEEDTKRIYKAKQTDYVRVLLTKGDESIVPKDRTRYFTSLLMMEYMLKFLCCHEYVHIINGHLGYVQEKLNMTAFDESPMTIDPLLSQVLEMDADMIALNILLRDWRYHTDQNKKIANMSDLAKVLSDEEYSLKTLMASILIFFTIMDTENYSMKEQEKMSHPQSQIRSWYSIASMASIFGARKDDKALNLLMKNINDIVFDVLIGFAEITDSDEAFRIPYLAKEEMQYVEKLQKEWNNVRELIIPYATHKIIAPRYESLTIFKNYVDPGYLRIKRKR